MSEVVLARKSLHRWLWDEFEVGYSKAVFDEINEHRAKISPNERQRKWANYTLEYPGVQTIEQVLFGSSFFRKIEAGTCGSCRQMIIREQKFSPDLTNPQDRGERHNCCVALDGVISGKFSRVIFLTDDFRAQRDYARPIFDKIPLGEIWSSLDFVTYLFTRYRRRIPLDEMLSVLRDVNANNPTDDDTSKPVRRLTYYQDKVREIDRILVRIKGGQ